ncbi:hypothetical protein BCT63_04435 [Vibrio kanaloae]|nr:hypothetical protein BCT63_04435 [Vibrio kanaloae]
MGAGVPVQSNSSHRPHLESLLIEQAFVVSGYGKWDLNRDGVHLIFEISSSPTILKKAVALFVIEGATAFLHFNPFVSIWFGT